MLLLPEMRDMLRALLQAREHKRDALFREFLRIAHAASRADPDIQSSIRKVLVRRLQDLNPRIRNLLDNYADRENTIIQSNEVLLRLLAPSVFPDPKPIEPTVAALYSDWTDGYCPLIACCLVTDRPCAFDHPWLEPHPFWRQERALGVPWPPAPLFAPLPTSGRPRRTV